MRNTLIQRIAISIGSLLLIMSVAVSGIRNIGHCLGQQILGAHAVYALSGFWNTTSACVEVTRTRKYTLTHILYLPTYHLRSWYRCPTFWTAVLLLTEKDKLWLSNNISLPHRIDQVTMLTTASETQSNGIVPQLLIYSCKACSPRGCWHPSEDDRRFSKDKLIKTEMTSKMTQDHLSGLVVNCINHVIAVGLIWWSHSSANTVGSWSFRPGGIMCVVHVQKEFSVWIQQTNVQCV